jgi:hypothetical protein
VRPTILDKALRLFGVPAASDQQVSRVPIVFHIKSERHDVTLLERVDRQETRKIELRIGASGERVVTELVTSICTATFVGRHLLITTGSHVFVLDGADIVFEDRVRSGVTTYGDVSQVVVAGELVILGTEFEVYSLALGQTPFALVHRWTTSSGILESMRFDGRVLEMRDEGGNVEVCHIE